MKKFYTSVKNKRKERMKKFSLHPSGKMICLDVETHTYTFHKKKTLRSVTTILNNWFPFNKEKISVIVATKLGITPGEVIEMWQKQADMGTAVHAVIEESLKAKAYLPSEATKQGIEPGYSVAIQKLIPILQEKYDFLHTEYLVGCPDLSVAGTIDAVGMNKKTGRLTIFDWKTQGKPTPKRSMFFEECCPAPLDHLTMNKVNRYMLQLYTYKFIAQREGYFKLKPGGFDQEIDLELILFVKNSTGSGVDVVQQPLQNSDVIPTHQDWEMRPQDVILKVLKHGMEK